jgi:hypothetical protein
MLKSLNDECIRQPQPQFDAQRHHAVLPSYSHKDVGFATATPARSFNSTHWSTLERTHFHAISMVKLSELEASSLPAKPQPGRPTAAVASQAQWPKSEEDWAKHRARIKQLYLDDDKPLKEVMAIMETTHLFRAS